MENLYVIDDMLYTYDELVKNELEEKAQYDYIEPVQVDLGNELYLIIDNSNINFEIIQEIEKGIYKSLTVNSIEILKALHSYL